MYQSQISQHAWTLGAHGASPQARRTGEQYRQAIRLFHNRRDFSRQNLYCCCHITVAVGFTVAVPRTFNANPFEVVVGHTNSEPGAQTQRYEARWFIPTYQTGAPLALESDEFTLGKMFGFASAVSRAKLPAVAAVAELDVVMRLICHST